MKPRVESRRSFIGKAGGAGASAALGLLLGACRTSEDLMRSRAWRARTQDFAGLREEYSLGPGVVYLNHASIGTIPRAAADAHRRYLEICESNPWLHVWGGAWDASRERTREAAAALFACEPGDVAITHNTTEGFNVLARGLELGRGDEVLFSSLNHPGASVCWRHAAVVRGFEVRMFRFPIRDVGRMSADDLIRLHTDQIRERTRVLVLPHVDNVVGIRHPVREIAAAAKKKGVTLVAVDGAQTAGMIPLDVPSLGVDVYCTSGHKWLQAPKGTGLMYVRKEARDRIRPLLVTWGQARWGRTVRKFEDYGTRNLAEVLVLGDCITWHRKLGPALKERRLASLWSHLRARVDGTEGVTWASASGWSLGSGVMTVRIRSDDPSAVATALRENHGIYVRPFRRDGISLLRISPNLINGKDELDGALEKIRDLLA